jgi:hypothetical protein
MTREGIIGGRYKSSHRSGIDWLLPCSLMSLNIQTALQDCRCNFQWGDTTCNADRQTDKVNCRKQTKNSSMLHRVCNFLWFSAVCHPYPSMMLRPFPPSQWLGFSVPSRLKWTSPPVRVNIPVVKSRALWHLFTAHWINCIRQWDVSQASFRFIARKVSSSSLPIQWLAVTWSVLCRKCMPGLPISYRLGQGWREDLLGKWRSLLSQVLSPTNLPVLKNI